jgi:biotin synthase
MKDLASWVKKAIAGERMDSATALSLLDPSQVELLPLLQAAFEVRKAHCGLGVKIHILNNAKNGNCPEDCNYCAQGQKADPKAITDYPMKSDEEILAEAERAYTSGAYRYCMVFAGRGPSDRRVDHLSELIKEIKSRYPLQVCVSPGLLKEGQAERLKAAGLDRLNHNLNTTESNYAEICSTHTFGDRLQTLQYAQNAGLEICSGVILGMGEGPQGVIQVFDKLADLKAKSIPVNFLVAMPNTRMGQPEKLTPEYCLRVLCAARFILPSAEIRAAGGREHHLRTMQSLALYPANSIFMDGYLNVMGSQQRDTLQMILDAGFHIECDEGIDVNALLQGESQTTQMKSSENLHPAKACH